MLDRLFSPNPFLQVLETPDFLNAAIFYLRVFQWHNYIIQRTDTVPMLHSRARQEKKDENQKKRNVT